MTKKKFVLLLCSLLLLLAVAGVGLLLSALSTRDADLLHELGLFRGTEKGYALDQPLHRGEAAVMLLRLLGEEDAARKQGGTHPFRDVPAWLDASLGYLYQQGLTQGMTAETFCPELDCSLQMYCAFLLRALGYTEEAGDYTYDEVLAFSKEKGLLPGNLSGEEFFLRDYAVFLSVQALSMPMKDGSGTLFDHLVEQGAIPEESASAHPELRKR